MKTLTNALLTGLAMGVGVVVGQFLVRLFVSSGLLGLLS